MKTRRMIRIKFLSVLRERLHLPETKTFEEYVDVDNEVQAHEELTEEVCIVITN